MVKDEQVAELRSKVLKQPPSPPLLFSLFMKRRCVASIKRPVKVALHCFTCFIPHPPVPLDFKPHLYSSGETHEQYRTKENVN